jgi:N-acetylneuraminic acid mutarotase
MNDTWAFNGTSWTQVSVSNRPPARENAAMATLGNEVVLFGGIGASNNGVLNDTWTLDGTSWTQHLLPNPPPARYAAPMAVLP